MDNNIQQLIAELRGQIADLKMQITELKNTTPSLLCMTVTKRDGSVPNADIGKHAYYYDGIKPEEETKAKRNPYRFYASETSGDINSVHVITMVMPLGGMNSGLFRFPRVGDKILVSIQSSEYYLFGYLPNADNPFNKTDKNNSEVSSELDFEGTSGVFEGEGEILRFHSAWDNEDTLSGKKFSEIGFYSKETAWEKKGGHKTNVDTLNIQSSGDIYQSADNYQQFAAKRFEIAVGHKIGKDDDSTMKAQEGALNTGDFHVSACGDITISCEKSITLKAGRSQITISDTGISISSRKSASAFATSWDSSVSLNPLTGVTINGSHVGILANTELTLKDSYGGGISSKIGAVVVNGIDIDIKTLIIPAYRCNVIKAAIEAAITDALMITGVGFDTADALGGSGEDGKNARKYASPVFSEWGRWSSICDLNNFAGNNALLKNYANTNEALCTSLANAAQIAVSIAASCCTALLATVPLMTLDIESEEKPAKQRAIRDGIIAACTITESSIYLTAANAIALGGASQTITVADDPLATVVVGAGLSDGSIHLTPGGGLEKNFVAERNFTIRNQRIETPNAANIARFPVALAKIAKQNADRWVDWGGKIVAQGATIGMKFYDASLKDL